MAIASSPTVWRRWLALELRQLREGADLSRQDTAKALGCTVAKVGYFESADRGVQDDDLSKLLALYKVPEDRRESYREAWRDSRKRGWWERYDERTLPTWHSLFVGLEQGASRLRVYEVQVVNGLLQTPDYAAEVMRRGPAPRAEEHVARLVEMRTTRQAALTRDPDPLELWVVLDEAALRRVVGGPALMASQLEHLAKMAERPNITIQVLPFAAGAHGSTSGRFTLLTFPLPTDHGLAYVEYRSGSVYLEAPREIEEHSLAFQQLCSLALPPDDSIRVVREIAEEYAHARTDQ